MHVFSDVGAQQGIEAPGPGTRRGQEFCGKVDLEAAGSRDRDRIGIVINAHPFAAQVVQIPSQPAPDIKHEP